MGVFGWMFSLLFFVQFSFFCEKFIGEGWTSTVQPSKKICPYLYG